MLQIQKINYTQSGKQNLLLINFLYKGHISHLCEFPQPMVNYLKVN